MARCGRPERRSRPDPGRKAMKSLHLLRHAKSSWKDPGLNDHDRPLSKRGRQTAKMMAAYLRRAKIAPDLVICSTAMRARQTLDPIAREGRNEHYGRNSW